MTLFFQIPHISDTTWCLSFSVWLTSLGRAMQVCPCDHKGQNVLPYCSWVIFHSLSPPAPFSLPLSLYIFSSFFYRFTHRRTRMCPYLGYWNTAAVNTGGADISELWLHSLWGLLRVFIFKSCCILSNAFSSSTAIDMLYYINWFLNIRPSLQSWNIPCKIHFACGWIQFTGILLGISACIVIKYFIKCNRNEFIDVKFLRY